MEGATISMLIPIWIYHEAAHAVVAEVCGQRVRCISWGDGDPRTDWTSVSLPLEHPTIYCRNLCTWMTIAYAGVCVDDSYAAWRKRQTESVAHRSQHDALIRSSYGLLRRQRTLRRIVSDATPVSDSPDHQQLAIVEDFIDQAVVPET